MSHATAAVEAVAGHDHGHDVAVAGGRLRDLPLHVFWALVAGPIFLLAQMRDAGEMEITDDVLRVTFDGVCRSVLPERDAIPA